MLEESLSAMSSWLTPAVLFVVLNLVIGTIAFTSASKSQSPPSANPHAPQPLPRSSSVLHRLRSLNLYRSEISPPSSDSIFPLLPDPAPIRENAVTEARIDEELEEEVEGLEGPTMEQVFSQIQKEASVYGRSKSDGGRILASKKVRKRNIQKAASDISSVIGGFEPPMEVDEEEEKVGGEEEVDGKAEDFINRFREQLKLQKMESFYNAAS